MSLTKVSYSMIGDAPINVKDYGAIGDGVANDTAAIQSAFNAANTAKGATVFFPSGDYLITSTLTLPRSAVIMGATRRGVGNPPSLIAGSGIYANFDGPAMKAEEATVTAYDLTISNLHIRGNKALYPSGDGLQFIKTADITLDSLIVSDFGGSNIALTGGYGATIQNVYCATSGGPNFYIDQEKCTLLNCQSDGGTYSVQGTVNSADMLISNGCFFEGSSVAGIIVSGQRTRIANSITNQTMGGFGIITGLPGVRLDIGSGVQVLGDGTAASTIGINLQDNIEYDLIGVTCSGFQTALSLISGAGSVVGGQYQGVVTGANITASGFGKVIVADAFISGPTNSLLHNSGSAALYIGCSFDNGTGTYKAPTIASGSPAILSLDGSNLLTMLSGAMSFPTNGLIVAGGGGTNIVSVGAVDSAGAGFRTLRIPN
jgi:hypothetical protein